MPFSRNDIHRQPLDTAWPVLLALLLTLLLPGLCSAANAQSPLILADAQRYSLEGHLEFLADPQGNLTLKEILQPVNQARFTPVAGLINRGYTNDTTWIKFSCLRRPQFPHDPILRLWPPFLDNLDIYFQTGGNPTDEASYRLIRTGDHVPAAERPITGADLAIPLELPENTICHFYLKIHTSSSLNLSAFLHTELDYMQLSSLSTASKGGYLAICLVIALINLILYFRLSDRLYLFFSLYVFFLFVNILASSGMITMFLPGIAHRLSDHMTGWSVGFSMFFMVLFAKRLFAAITPKIVNYLFTAVCIASCLTAVSTHFNAYNRAAPALFILSLLVIFVLTWLSIEAIRRKDPNGSFYLVAFGIANIGYSSQFLRLLGLLPVTWWNMNAVEVASIFNMVLMTLAMTERVRRAEILALEAAVAAEQNATVLAEAMTADLRNNKQQLEAALENERKSLQQKDRFVAMLNHEYRTPLAIIQTNISVLEIKTAELDLKLSPLFNKIKKAMERLVEVLETSILLEKQGGADSWRHQQLIPVGSFLKGIVGESKNLWPELHLAVTIADMRGVTVTGDTILLKTALLNLLDNAFKYSPPGSSTTLEAVISGSNAVITISDQGCGIDAEHLDLVFEKGYRVSNALNNSGKGVGLYLTKSIIEQYGGTITLARGDISGTVVTVTLPCSLPKEHGNE